MTTRNTLASLVTKFEHVFEGLLFGVTSVVVLSGVIAMCVQPTLFA